MTRYSLAIDIGGTFTDAVLLASDGQSYVDKTLTTHNNLLESLDGLSNIEGVGEFEVTKNKILPQCDAKQFAAQRSDETRVGQNAGPSCE